MRANLFVWVVWVLGLASLSRPTFAQDRGSEAERVLGGSDQDPRDVEARLHFELGRRHYDRGEYGDAERELLAALALRQDPLLRFNLYVVYRDSQRIAEAREQLALYLPSVVDPQERSRLEGRLRAMDAELARTPTSADTPVSETEQAQRGPPPLVEHPSRTSLEPAPWVVLGVGGAMLLASIVTGTLALDADAELNGMCDASGCPPGHDAIESRGWALAITTDALWIGGAAVAGVGLLWGVLSLTSTSEVSTRGGCTMDGCRGEIVGRF